MVKNPKEGKIISKQETLGYLTRAAHRPSDGYGRTTNGQVTGTGSPSTVRLVMSAKSQRVRMGTGTAVVRGTVVDGRPPVPHTCNCPLGFCPDMILVPHYCI